MAGVKPQPNSSLKQVAALPSVGWFEEQGHGDQGAKDLILPL